MTKEMKQDWERFGKIVPDSKTWVHPWETYYHFYVKSHHNLLIKILSKKYPDFIFYNAESVCCNTISHIINFERK